nr:hypothetical protein Itr_chr07CG11750 [Ipomoea trifida]
MPSNGKCQPSPSNSTAEPPTHSSAIAAAVVFLLGAEQERREEWMRQVFTDPSTPLHSAVRSAENRGGGTSATFHRGCSHRRDLLLLRTPVWEGEKDVTFTGGSTNCHLCRLVYLRPSPLYEKKAKASVHLHVAENRGESCPDCKSLVQHFHEINIMHVLREGNQCADFLANLGQTFAWGTTVLNRPPEGMIELLDRDAHGAALSRRILAVASILTDIADNNSSSGVASRSCNTRGVAKKKLFKKLSKADNNSSSGVASRSCEEEVPWAKKKLSG